MNTTDRDSDYYQNAIALTPAQLKAFNALKRAVKACRKENVFFYQCLETLGALNGNNVNMVGGVEDFRESTLSSPNCLQYKHYPTTWIVCSFADDNHFVKLHDE